jgi:hypothetical protein
MLRCQNREVTDSHETARRPWVEPTSLLRLRWGGYRARWMSGLALIMTGTGVVMFSSAYSIYLLLIGSLMIIAGWIVQPTAVWRRVAIMLPAFAGSWLLISGPAFSVCFAIPLTAWLVVRQRPSLSYVVVALPIASGLVLGNIVYYYFQTWISLSIGTVVTVLAAWLAQRIAAATYNRQARSSIGHSVSPEARNLG